MNVTTNNNTNIKDNTKILGKTNSRGFLLVPNLEPYYLARLGVDAKDLSIFASSNDFNGGIELIPGFQTAHEIKFAAKMVRYVHFNLLQGQKRLLPGTKINIVDEQHIIADINRLNHHD